MAGPKQLNPNFDPDPQAHHTLSHVHRGVGSWSCRCLVAAGDIMSKMWCGERLALRKDFHDVGIFEQKCSAPSSYLPHFLHARSTWCWMKVRRMVFEPLKWRWPKTGVVWDLEIWIGTTCSAFLTRCVIYVCEDFVYVDIVLNQRACSYVAYACIRMYYRHKCEETANQWYLV